MELPQKMTHWHIMCFAHNLQTPSKYSPNSRISKHAGITKIEENFSSLATSCPFIKKECLARHATSVAARKPKYTVPMGIHTRITCTMKYIIVGAPVQ